MSETASGAPRAPGEPSTEDRTDILPAWKIVLRLIGFRRGLWLGNLLAMLVLIASFMVPGVLIREFFALVAGDPSARFGLWALVGLLLLSEIGGVGGLFGLVLLRKNMLSRILRRPGAAALPDSPGEAISRFRGDTFELPLFALWMNDLVGMLAAGTAGLILMVTINARIALYAALPFLVVAFISNAATKRIEHYRRESRRAAGIVTGFVAEMFGAVQAIKVACAEESVLGHFRRINETRKHLAIRDRIFSEVLHSIFWNSANIGTGVVLILAAGEMAAGRFTVGDFALFVFYLGFLSELTTFSGLLIARYKQLGISVQRMYRLMPDSPPDALVA
ncbi:MAG: ABC transporter transmembrane domain-containing protein, partial [Spirochaetota bacterium]